MLAVEAFYVNKKDFISIVFLIGLCSGWSGMGYKVDCILGSIIHMYHD